MTHKDYAKLTYRAMQGERVVVQCLNKRASDRAFRSYADWLDSACYRIIDGGALKWSAHKGLVVFEDFAGSARFVSSAHQLDGVMPENIVNDFWGEYE